MILVVTDSGLGGLSVAAALSARLRSASPWPRVRLIYFNCRPNRSGGFSAMETIARRVRVFNRVLECIRRRYEPHHILVACNTLSVLLDRTAFVRSGRGPVFGVVSAGVDLIAERGRAHPEETLLLFGTGTTVRTRAHKKLLMRKGLPSGRLVYKECPRLDTAIEYDPDGGPAAVLMRTYVKQALRRLPAPLPPLAAALLCTHYGYALPLWKKLLREAAGRPVAVLDPNTRMVDGFLAAAPAPGGAAQVTVEVVSQVPIGCEQKEAVGRQLRPVCAATAAALTRDAVMPGLFDTD